MLKYSIRRFWSRKLEFKTFNILRSCPWMLKGFALNLFGPPNLQIENFNILEHDPRIQKFLIWGFKNKKKLQIRRFRGPKTSNSKVLTAWLDAKSFDLGWRPGLEVWESKNIQIEVFSIQGHDLRMLELSNSRFWGPKTSNSNFLTSWAHLTAWLDAKSFNFGCPPVWRFGDPKTSKLKLLASRFNILEPSVRLAGC